MHELILADIFILLQDVRQPVTKSDELFWVIVILAFLIGTTIGIIITQLIHIIRKSVSKGNNEHKNSTVSSNSTRQVSQVKKPHVSLCPVCHTYYTDPNLRYCLSDGTLLFLNPKKIYKDSEETLVLPKI